MFLDVLIDFLTHYLTHILPYDRKPRGEVKTPLKQGFYLSVMKKSRSATLHGDFLLGSTWINQSKKE